MRRLVALLATLVLVPLGAAPAHAVDTSVTVDGFGYPSGLDYVSRPCGTTPFDGNTTQRLYRADGAIGDHATGLGFSGGTTGEAGVRAIVATPSELTEVSFETLHPAGPAGSSPGHYFVSLDPSSSGFQTYYYANLSLNVGIADWGSWDSLAGWPLDWYYWDGASSSSGPVVLDTTVAQFATTYGNGSGARLGFLFGCDGRDYYMDNFRVGVGSTTTVYDFEGIPSETYIGSWNYEKKKVQYPGRITLVSGQGHWVAGDGYSYGDDKGYGSVAKGWFPGKARLYAKRHGRSKFSRVSSDEFTLKRHAWFKIRPTTNTVYVIDNPGTSTFEGSSSATLTVQVKRRVRARIADRTIYRGQSIKVAGYLKPRTSGIRVSLQRRTGGGWQTIAKGFSRSGGEFSLAPRARTAGKWVVRVVAAKGKGNLGNASYPASVIVRVPPPRPVPQGQPDPVPVEDPEPPVEDEPTGEPKPGRNVTLDQRLRNQGAGLTAPPAPAGGASPHVVDQDEAS